MKNIAEEYIELFQGDREARKGFLACAAALRLDDKIARKAIEVVAETNGTTQAILRQIKGLGCVWRQWDGIWYYAEDVRSYLLSLLEKEVPAEKCVQLRNLLASYNDELADQFSHDGQLTAYRNRQAQFEAAYQHTLIPDKTEEGAKQFADIWRKSKGAAREATANAVDYVSREIEYRFPRVPLEILFLRGMSARGRGNKISAEKYFRIVWENGGKGDIFAIAAHLFGLLVYDPVTAEKAFRDSIAWYDIPSHQGQVWHSLGNLLSKHSRRWSEAEEAYKKSLELLADPGHQGQVYASWADNLLKLDEPKKYGRIEEFALKALSLAPRNLKTSGISNRILAAVYESRGVYQKAIEALEALMQTNARLNIAGFNEEIQSRIDELRQKL